MELQSAEELREIILAQHRQLETLRREAADAELLVEALKALLDVASDVEPFTAVFAVLEPVFQFQHALVLVEDERTTETLHCVVATDPALVGSQWPSSRMIDKVLAGRVVATVSLSHGAALPTPAQDSGLTDEQPALYLPLGFRDRRGLLLLLRAPDAPGYDRRDVTVARKLALLASQAFATRMANRSETERRRLAELTAELREAQETLAHRANHDLVTGLPSRAWFDDTVDRLLRASGPDDRLALVFIDLDGFKQVNDHYGHDVGDQLLTAVGNRLRAHIRHSDILARISGDEFVVLLNPLRHRSEIDDVIKRMLASLNEPFPIGPLQLMASASVGIALFPDHGTTYEQLRRNADIAMYSAKSASRGSAAYFDTRLGHAAASRARLEQDLRHAVGERRFRCMLQPKVDIREGLVTGFEALARQVGPTGDVGESAAFVDLAAQLGLLDHITEIVLDDVIATMPRLDAAFGPHTTMSINISTRQATDAAKLRPLLDRLVATGTPERFILEMTEDALLKIDVFQREILPLVADSGVAISIDDFGAGYASLSRLLHVPADEVKIDRSFITAIHRRPRSQVVLEGLAWVSEKLGVSVVAEGVETASELQYLLERTTIATGQGYLFQRPALPERLVADAPRLRARLRVEPRAS